MFLKLLFSFQMAECRERLTRAREEWLNTPESLENCSVGLCFPVEDVETYQVKKIMISAIAAMYLISQLGM